MTRRVYSIVLAAKKGGDLFKFVEEIERLSFSECLEFLAEIAGIELPKNRGFGPNREQIERYRSLLEKVTRFYEKQLKSNKAAKAYLTSRGTSKKAP